MNEKPDPLSGVLAEVDQAIAAMPVMAQYAWGCYDAFRNEGFSDEQAFQLTRDQIARALES